MKELKIVIDLTISFGVLMGSSTWCFKICSMFSHNYSVDQALSSIFFTVLCSILIYGVAINGTKYCIDSAKKFFYADKLKMDVLNNNERLDLIADKFVDITPDELAFFLTYCPKEFLNDTEKLRVQYNQKISQ